MSDRLRLADTISLFRIALSAAFLVLFRAQYGPSFMASLVCAGLAQASDHLDGYLVRKYASPTLVGWVFDSFADRAFYIAAILAFQREFGLSEILIWAFTLRELCLYASRVVVGDFQLTLPAFRTLALIHAGIIRIAIMFGCIVPFALVGAEINALIVNSVGWMLWLATAMGYANLYVLFRAQQ